MSRQLGALHLLQEFLVLLPAGDGVGRGHHVAQAGLTAGSAWLGERTEDQEEDEETKHLHLRSGETLHVEIWTGLLVMICSGLVQCSPVLLAGWMVTTSHQISRREETGGGPTRTGVTLGQPGLSDWARGNITQQQGERTELHTT